MEANIYITDKTGKKSFNTVCGYGYHNGELNNLRQRLQWCKEGKVSTVDPESARLVMVVDGKEIDPDESITQDDLDLLSQLYGS